MGALDGRTAVLTGSGRGIGREVALLLGTLGANVIVNDPGVNVDGTVAVLTAVGDREDEAQRLGAAEARKRSCVTE